MKLQRSESIKGVLQAIDSRLQELEGEKEELQRYERLDREHRALQYALHDGELQRARTALEALDGERDQHADRADDAHADLAEADRVVDSAQKAQDRALADAESEGTRCLASERSTINIFSKKGRGPGAARRSPSARRARCDVEGPGCQSPFTSDGGVHGVATRDE